MDWQRTGSVNERNNPNLRLKVSPRKLSVGFPPDPLLKISNFHIYQDYGVLTRFMASKNSHLAWSRFREDLAVVELRAEKHQESQQKGTRVGEK